MSKSAPPDPAVAVIVLEGLAAPNETPPLKNWYVSAPTGTETAIRSPEQYELSSTPVDKDESKFAFALTVTILESVLEQDTGSSKTPFAFVSKNAKAILLNLVWTVKLVVGVYVWEVAPPISPHGPALTDDCHWYAIVAEAIVVLAAPPPTPWVPPSIAPVIDVL